ncbi:hypothetical protein E2C01_061214 [Portunus trituberculatus]|uniref:Uncharacterized protein n=1 Tax=Portunus trituberculatus TaxID=210409 RepID=A0A5B7H7I2_PORTR|nr:hypothetical protein [Portunus trituberculatus]
MNPRRAAPRPGCPGSLGWCAARLGAHPPFRPSLCCPCLSVCPLSPRVCQRYHLFPLCPPLPTRGQLVSSTHHAPSATQRPTTVS